MAFDTTDPLMAEAVAEVEVEKGRTYERGSWRGWTNAAGFHSPRMHVPPDEQRRLNERTMEKFLEKRQREQAELEGRLASEEEAREAAEAEALQQRAFADELMGGGGGGQEEEGGTGRRGRGWGRSPFSEVSVPRHVGNLMGTIAGAGAGVLGMGMGVALSPLGTSGAAAAQVGNAVVGLVTSGLQTVANVGSGALTLALGGLLAGAVGSAGVLVLDAVSDLFGKVAETMTTAIQGVVTIIRDVFRDAGEYARSAMQMVYMGGHTLEGGVGAISAFGALGMSPQQTAGMLGRWEMRPEFLAARMAPLGGLQYGAEGEVDWANTLRTMRGTLAGYPEMAQYPMLQAVMGGQGAQQLMPMMQMRPEAFEGALAGEEALRPQVQGLRELQEELAPMQAQVGLLAMVLKTELAGAALEPLLGLLRTLLEVVRENRGAFREWLADLPSRLADWIGEAARQAERLLDALPAIGRTLGEIVGHLRGAWDVLMGIGGFLREHPTLSAALAGAGAGALRGGWGGAVGGALMGVGAQVGASEGGVWGGIGGGVAGILAGGAALRYGPGLALGALGMGAETLAFPGRMAAERLAFPAMRSGFAAGFANMAVPTGFELAGTGTLGTAGGLAGLGAGSMLALVAGIAAAATGIAAWTSGWWGAYRQQRESERQWQDAQEASREAGYVTRRDIARGMGPATLRDFEEGELLPAATKELERRYQAALAARGTEDGAEGWSGKAHDVLGRIQDAMQHVRDNTSPDRVREAVRRGQQEAQGELRAVIELRPASRLEEMLELYLVESNYRALQVALG